MKKTLVSLLFWAVIVVLWANPVASMCGRTEDTGKPSAPVPTDTLPTPVPRSLEEIAGFEGADTDLFLLAYNPLVLLVDFADLHTQARALNRIALYIEGDGTAGKILTDNEVSRHFEARHKSPDTYYYGHDYTADDLARFFTAMGKSKVSITGDERFILRVATENGIIRKSGHRYERCEPRKVLLSISKSRDGSGEHLSRDLRQSTLRHEASHAEYFTNAAYRAYCSLFWNSLTPRQRRIFSDELKSLGYDTGDEQLLLNEMQAFLWEPEKGAFIDIFLRRENTSLEALRMRFLRGLQTARPKISRFFDSAFARQVKDPLRG